MAGGLAALQRDKTSRVKGTREVGCRSHHPETSAHVPVKVKKKKNHPTVWLVCFLSAQSTPQHENECQVDQDHPSRDYVNMKVSSVYPIASSPPPPALPPSTQRSPPSRADSPKAALRRDLSQLQYQVGLKKIHTVYWVSVKPKPDFGFTSSQRFRYSHLQLWPLASTKCLHAVSELFLFF